MSPVVKNILAVILGWIGGSIINMSLIQMGHNMFPIEGLDPEDMEAFAKIIPTLDSKYFIFPFLGHAFGTLIGALIAGILATKRKMMYALIIGGIFLLGGIVVNILLPGPIWFAASDIVLAYIPMAWIGGKIALKISNK